MTNNYEYRGKDKEGVWRYGFYYEYAVGSFIRVTNGDGGFEDFKVCPKTVGQWTGRLDRDKKEIYKDDNLKCKLPDSPHCIGRTFTGVVEYNSEDARFQISEYKDGEPQWDIHNFYDDLATKVISNIHDNET